MKKIFIMLVFIGLIFSVYAQENFLQVLSNEQENYRTLEILQENNEKYIQKNEEIIRLTEEIALKEKKAQKQNTFIGGFNVGVNFPFACNEISSLNTPVNTSVPYGVTLGAFTALEKASLKFNANIDWTNIDLFPEELSFFSISLGRAPIHNYHSFFGYYLTFGFESLSNVTLFNIGGSGFMYYNVTGKMRLYLSLDVTTRRYPDDSKELPVSLEPLVDTWRINPSIGLVFLQ